MIQWTGAYKEAFETLKDLLYKEPILQLPDFNKEFILGSDASQDGPAALRLVCHVLGLVLFDISIAAWLGVEGYTSYWRRLRKTGRDWRSVREWTVRLDSDSACLSHVFQVIIVTSQTTRIKYMCMLMVILRFSYVACAWVNPYSSFQQFSLFFFSVNKFNISKLYFAGSYWSWWQVESESNDEK